MILAHLDVFSENNGVSSWAWGFCASLTIKKTHMMLADTGLDIRLEDELDEEEEDDSDVDSDDDTDEDEMSMSEDEDESEEDEE